MCGRGRITSSLSLLLTFPLPVAQTSKQFRRSLCADPPTRCYKSSVEATFVRTGNATAAKIAADILRVYANFRAALYADEEHIA